MARAEADQAYELFLVFLIAQNTKHQASENFKGRRLNSQNRLPNPAVVSPESGPGPAPRMIFGAEIRRLFV